MPADTFQLSPAWACVADTVMGGVSTGGITVTDIHGRTATRLQGTVSLDNNGGFIQMASDLKPDGTAFDASGWNGLELEVCGNAETYELRLRTDELTRPWQSFRAGFEASEDWLTLRFAFENLEPHRTPLSFDATRLCRMGVLAIGREFRADIAIAGVRLYR